MRGRVATSVGGVATAPRGGAGPTGRGLERPGPGRGLSAKLLAVTVLFLLLGEVLIFVPSVARFRLVYLQQMISAAHLASLVKLARGEERLEPAFERELLRHVGAEAVTLWRPDAETMLGETPPVQREYDLRRAGPLRPLRDALAALGPGPDRMIRAIGVSPRDPDVLVDVVFEDGTMRRELRAYGIRVLALSLVLSAIVAFLLFLSLRRTLLMPLAAVTQRLAAFRSVPEDAGLDGAPEAPRRDEIGVIERELARMQRDLRLALKGKTRLAALGAAVGEVSHDLKNILASAVLISDRLDASADPTAREVAPRLMATLERAVRLCATTLRFAREQPPEPRLAAFPLRDLVEEVGAAVAVGEAALVWRNLVGPGVTAFADRDQLYRVFLNLARNGREAIGRRPGAIACRARVADGTLEVEFVDDGPGIPEALRPRLFAPFAASTKPDGSGLGLTICREIMRSHGGEIELARTGPNGTTFRLTLPDRSGRADV